MSTTRLLADPGIGRERAPLGTVDWAQRIRLDVQGRLDEIPRAPLSAFRLLEAIRGHQGWTLMNKPDGTFFATFEEFCAFKEPWGLGRPWETVREVLQVALGRKWMEDAFVTYPRPSREQRRGRLARLVEWLDDADARWLSDYLAARAAPPPVPSGPRAPMEQMAIFGKDSPA